MYLFSATDMRHIIHRFSTEIDTFSITDMFASSQAWQRAPYFSSKTTC